MLPTHVIDDVLLGVVIVSSGQVDRTYYVDLVVLESRVVFVHVYYVIRVVYSKSAKQRKNFI